MTSICTGQGSKEAHCTYQTGDHLKDARNCFIKWRKDTHNRLYCKTPLLKGLLPDDVLESMAKWQDLMHRPLEPLWGRAFTYRFGAEVIELLTAIDSLYAEAKEQAKAAKEQAKAAAAAKQKRDVAARRADKAARASQTPATRVPLDYRSHFPVSTPQPKFINPYYSPVTMPVASSLLVQNQNVTPNFKLPRHTSCVT